MSGNRFRSSVADKIILEVRNISKEFPGVKALDRVTLRLRQGEVHIVAGENGAGKSTLMKILAGAYRKDAGDILIDGQVVEIDSPQRAQELGISAIYQEFSLVPQMSVAENIFLGREPRLYARLRLVNWGTLYQEARRALDQLEADIDPRAPVRSLGLGQMQMVEIARALSARARILIMDEPTAALAEKEVNRLFTVVRRLAAAGISVFFISHHLEEFHQIGDRISVLRDGCYTGTRELRDTDLGEIVRMMVGRELKGQLFPRRAEGPAEAGRPERLRVEGLTRKGAFENVSFYVRAGEVVGLAGLMGAGRTELVRALFGADPIHGGRIYVDGQEVSIRSPQDAIAIGMGFLTEDRKAHGLNLLMTLRENVSLANLRAVLRNGLISYREERQVSQQFVETLSIKTPGVEERVANLSGGNQQKVVLARWLFTRSRIFIFDEPTRGIDVGAKVEIHRLIRQLADQGSAVVMISSEMPEILGMSDRIYVMSAGRMTAELCGEEATPEAILHYATAEAGH